jgi:hypothetical protein
VARKNDYGIKIAKPGHDVKTAADFNLLFSSSWPNITIAKEIITDDFKNSSNPSGHTGVPHGLSYAPFVIGHSVTNGIAQTIFPNCTETVIRMNISFPNPTTFGTVNIKCYNVDLGKNANYVLLNPAIEEKGGHSSDFGAKLSQRGKSVYSNDLRDFIFHSRAQSPQVLTVITESKPQGGTLVYDNVLGYQSWVFGYVKNNLATFKNTYSYAPYYSQGYPVTSVTVTGVSITYVAGDTATLVVLRDPMFSATKTAVAY